MQTQGGAELRRSQKGNEPLPVRRQPPTSSAVLTILPGLAVARPSASSPILFAILLGAGDLRVAGSAH